MPPAKLPVDARLLLITEEIRRGHSERAQPWLAGGGDSADLTFLSPLINAWTAADRGHVDQALTIFDEIPSTSLLAPILPEQRAFLLLKARRTAEAEPLARQAVGGGGLREQRLRLAFADGFLAAGDRPRALMIVEGMGEGEIVARQRVMAGRQSGQAVDNLPEAFGEMLTAFSGDLTRLQRSSPPIGLIQVARYANPQSSSITALLALVLASQKRSDEALKLLRAVSPGDALIGQVRDVQTRILVDNKRFNEAYQIAASAAAATGARSTI